LHVNTEAHNEAHVNTEMHKGMTDDARII